MAQAYVPIQTQTLTSTATTVTFSNIPQNYTDLMLKISARDDTGSSAWGSIYLRFNGSATGYSGRQLTGNGSTTASSSDASWGTTYALAGRPTGGGATASTFGNSEIYIPNYTSSNNKSISGDGVSENNGTSSLAMLVASLWSNTAAITQIDVLTPGQLFQVGSTFTLYGIGGTRASGGTITADSQYTYHTFTSTGTFTALENIRGAEVLCIGGGGAGNGGGGGGGGVLYATNQTLNAGTSYSAIIGAGGSTTSGNGNANPGSDSQFAGFVGIGGGGGSAYGASGNNGGSGGSGGGAANSNSTVKTGGSATQGSGINYVGYGNAGGNAAASTVTGGGGGGAGAAGGVSSANTGGNGGNGTSLFSAWGYATNTGQLSGGLYYYAGGGGGGAATTAGIGGLGGGTAGAISGTPTAGTANTGGGAGGGYSGISTITGGSGLVIIRYPN